MWGRKPVIEIPQKMTEIQLTGIEDLNRKNRPIRPGIRFFGTRTADLAGRIVVVELNEPDAEEIIEHMASLRAMPIIEVPDKSWAYVATIGEGEAKFKKEDE